MYGASLLFRVNSGLQHCPRPEEKKVKSLSPSPLSDMKAESSATNHSTQ